MIRVSDKKLEKLKLTNKIVGEVTKKTPDEDLDAGVKATLEVAIAIKALSEKEVVQPDFTPLADAIISVGETQEKIIGLIVNPPRPKQWEFSIIRDSKGNINNIKAQEHQ